MKRRHPSWWRGIQGGSQPPKLGIGVTLLAVSMIVTPAWASELRFASGPYKYIVMEQELRDVLTEFGRNTNVALKLSDDVRGRVRGPLPMSNAAEFLKRLCQSYGLVWYYDGSVLHIDTEAELRTESVDLGDVRPDELAAGLKGLDAVDTRFGVNVNSDAAVVTVSGSPPYVVRVREMIAALAKAKSQRKEGTGDDSRVHVFRGGS